MNGFFDAGDAIIHTDHVTLTCATPGSGLRGRPVGLIVRVYARGVTVSDLVLDATSSLEGAYLAFFDGVTAFGEDIQFLRNTVTCGATNKCVFFGSESHAAAHGGLVADNYVAAAGAKFGGVTIQGVSGARIERNTIVATAPSAKGILANGDESIVVSDNVVSGPWAVSLAFDAGVFHSSVERNRLEGAVDDGADLFFVDGLRFLSNEVSCGSGACIFMNSGPGALIADNRFESAGSGTGVQLQNGIDGTRVERNTIIATARSTVNFLGAIRVRDGSDVVVADNVVVGPWINSVAPTSLVRSRFEGNDLEGAQRYGIRMSAVFAGVPPPMTNNLFRSNRITAAATAGILGHLACANQFIGNNLQGNAGNMGAIFDETTGANILAGNMNIVIDDGLGDCNGDGVADVGGNIITGRGLVLRGMPFSPPPSDAAATSSRFQ